MKLSCTNCGGDVPIEVESEFVRCGFCQVDLYVEMDQTVRQLYLEFQLEQHDCHPYLEKRLLEMEIRGDISLESVKSDHIPYWCFERKEIKPSMVCAAEPPVQEMNWKQVPPGKPKVKKEQIGKQKEKSETIKSMNQALAEFLGRRGLEAKDDDISYLLEIPVFLVEYSMQGKVYTAVVDGITGEVHGDDFPPSIQRKKDKFLGIVAILTCGVFAIEALVISSVWATFLVFAITGASAYAMTIRTLRQMGW